MQKYETREWDLSELVQDPKSEEFEAQIRQIWKMTELFARQKSKLEPKISAGTLMSIMLQKEKLVEKMSIVAGYASLRYAADTQSEEATSLMTRIAKLGSEISNNLLFLDLWWKQKLDEKSAQMLIKKSGDLQGYLTYKRMVGKYSLSEPEERIINTLDVTGASALVKMYDKITSAFEYNIKISGKEKTMSREQLTNFVKSTDPKLRESAYKTLLSKYSDNKGVIGEIYQNIVLNWKDTGVQIRKYQSPISVRNIENYVSDDTVSSLLDTCKKNRTIFQKFFKQKAKTMGTKRLRRYDLYAAASKSKGKTYTYDKAVRLVLRSLKEFSPKLHGYAKDILARNHVDSSPRPGKRDGAFCSTLGPKIAPFILLSYTGKIRDVFTLAHEMGHAVHSQSASGRSILVQESSLPLAETASTFSELLLYDSMTEKMSDGQKKSVMYDKIDDLYATIMRQSFFTLFEIDAHKQIAQNTTIGELSRTYLANLKTQFGRSVEVTDDFAIEWSSIPHFYHAPFYCYAYAFGNLLALSLFQRYKKEGSDFAATYVDILAAGGSIKPETLLKQHGIDITSTKFWQKGFGYISDHVSKLSKI